MRETLHPQMSHHPLWRQKNQPHRLCEAQQIRPHPGMRPRDSLLEKKKKEKKKRKTTEKKITICIHYFRSSAYET